MSENEKTGTISLIWEDQNGKKIEKKSPTSFYEEAEKLLHVLNQKSSSGNDMLDFAVKYIETVRKTRKSLPDNTRIIIDVRTKSYHRNLNMLLADYESFILASTLVSYEVETFGEKKSTKVSSDDLSWLTED